MVTASPARPDFSRGFAGYANAAPPRHADPASLQHLQGRTMGTTWSLTLANRAMRPLADVRATVEGALACVASQMSTWEPDASISRFNRAPAGTWQVLEPAFEAVLRCGLAWAEASAGACDPTVGPLVDLWGFGPRAHAPAHSSEPPAPEALAAARARVGWQRVQLDARCGLLQPGGLALDLSGMAKGFAVDLVLQRLAEEGLSDVLVEIGGELRSSGRRPDGLPWRTAVAAPVAGASGPIAQVVLQDMAIATSGDGWHAFEHAGRRYSHTIDPRSGEPVAHALASVTVLHRQCLQADVLATVLAVLGPYEGHAWACRRGLAALFVERMPAGHEPVSRQRATPAFDALPR